MSEVPRRSMRIIQQESILLAKKRKYRNTNSKKSRNTNPEQEGNSSSSSQSDSEDFYSAPSNSTSSDDDIEEGESSPNNNTPKRKYSNPQSKSDRTLECILDKKTLSGTVKYRVKWIGVNRCTWETEADLKDYKDKVKEFLRKREKEISKRRKIGATRRKISLMKKKEGKEISRKSKSDIESDEIAQIIDKDEDGYYLVKWKNAGHNNVSWEPYSSIRKYNHLIKKFEKKRKLNSTVKEISEKTTPIKKRNILFELECETDR